MNLQRTGRWLTLSGLLILIGISGCGTTKNARLLTWRTVQYDVSGVERLAVLGFRAPEDVSAAVENITLENLQASGFYQVVHGPGTTQNGNAHLPLPSEPGGLDQIVARGRQLRADAVLVGRVRKRLDDGKKLGNVTILIGAPRLDIMIEYYIVDVRSGHVRSKQSITRSQSDEAFTNDSRSTTLAVDSMVKECSEEMVSQITAGSEMTEVELARVNMGKGSGYIRDGNKLAGAGKWKEAAEEYIAAVEVNPDCHEAIYNIGLTAEAQGRFGEAEQMYRKAMKRSDEQLYRDALARVANTGSNYQLAQQQIAQRPRWRFRPGDQVGHQLVGPPAQNQRNDAPRANNSRSDRIARGTWSNAPQYRPQHPDLRGQGPVAPTHANNTYPAYRQPPIAPAQYSGNIPPHQGDRNATVPNDYGHPGGEFRP